MVTLLLPLLQPGSPPLMFLFFCFLHHRATLFVVLCFGLSSTTTLMRRQAFEEQRSGKTTEWRSKTAPSPNPRIVDYDVISLRIFLSDITEERITKKYRSIHRFVRTARIINYGAILRGRAVLVFDGGE
jgi:hypothetical protein